MKTNIILALLAATPALLAAEPNPSVQPELMAKPPATQEDIADQAVLVQQLGAEASRGFDPETHAHALRAQIESLLALSTRPKSSAPNASATAAPSNQPVVKPAAPLPSANSTAGPLPPPSSVRTALQNLRAALDELELRLRETRTDQ